MEHSFGEAARLSVVAGAMVAVMDGEAGGDPVKSVMGEFIGSRFFAEGAEC